jgi:hypothetical protein
MYSANGEFQRFSNVSKTKRKHPNYFLKKWLSYATDGKS